jgi:hypothetical protein
MESNEHLLEPHHLGVPACASQIISKPIVHLVQKLQLSRTNTNDVSKRTKTRFNMAHVTKEFQRVCPK